MPRFIKSGTIALAILCAGHASAEPAFGHEGQAQVFQLEASARFSVVHAPFFTAAFPELGAHGFLFTLAAHYSLSSEWSLGGRLPLAALSVRQPAGSYVDEAAWGNPTLSVTRSIEAARLGRRGLAAWLGTEAGVPLAEHGPADALLQNRALEAANAADAYLSPESNLPATLPFVLRAGGHLEATPWSAESEIAVPLLLRVGDAGLPVDARTHRLGVWPSVQATLGVRALRWLRVSLGANIAVAAVRVFEPWQELSPVQASLRARLGLRFSKQFGLGLTFLAPVAGALGGEVYSGGMTLQAHR